MVTRWDIITVGNLSRNPYWGEDESRPVRPTMCTCTLVTGEGWRLLVDPSCQDRQRMTAELDRRSGLRLTDIDAVFITHDHGDHHFGLAHFPNAIWYAAPGVAEKINGSGSYARKVEPVSGLLLDTIDVIPTPGHTPDHHSLRFDCDGMSVVIAGDAVMTRDFFRDQQGYFNSADIQMAGRTIGQIARAADAVVPGHGNWFVTGR